MARKSRFAHLAGILAIGLTVAWSLSPPRCMAQAEPDQNSGPQARLQTADLDPADIVVPESSRGFALESDSEAYAERQIRAALARPFAVNFQDTPLRDVRRAIQRQLGEDVVLDTLHLTDAGVTDDTKFTFSATALSGKTVLRSLLRSKDLAWIIEGGAIQITTSDSAKSATYVRVYPVADLMLAARSDGGYTFDFYSLSELIESTISPSGWDSNGGYGSIASYDASGAVVINQTDEVHEQIALLLEKLRQVRHVQGLDAELRPWRDEEQATSSSGDETTAEASPWAGLAFGAAQPPAPTVAPQPRWRLPRVYH